MAIALVTGASSGIGLEITRILAPDHEVVPDRRRAREQRHHRDFGLFADATASKLDACHPDP